MLVLHQVALTALCFASAVFAAGGKRGLAYNNASLTLPFKGSSHISWAYDWYQAYTTPYNTDLEYVPMLWSDAADLRASWASNVARMQAAGSKHLLAFNEPDLCAFGAGSSCMEMNASVAAYQKYIQPYAGKMLLGSPAVTNAGAPGGLTWLSQFMGNCTGCQIDFLSLHWYSNKYAGLNYLKSHINEARKVANGRPIWLTEFGLTDDYTTEELKSFLSSAMTWMDSQPDIEGYSYFFDAVGTNWLIGPDYQLNDIGKLYAGMDGASAATSSSTSMTSSTAASTTTKATSTSSPASAKTTASTSSSVPASSKTSTSSSAVASSKTSTASTAKTTTSVVASSPTTTSRASSAVPTTSNKASTLTTSRASTTTSQANVVVSMSSSSSASAIPTGLPVNILSAVYVTQSVTAKSKSLWQHGSTILFQSGGNLWKKLGLSSNPWPDHTNTLNVYYSRGNKQRVATYKDSSPDCNLSTDTCGSTIVTAPVTKPAKSPITLVAVVWGDRVLTTATLWSRLYKAAQSGSSFQATNSFFGATPMPGQGKTAVIWYRNSRNDLKVLTAKQNATVRFS
ncbi:hypothetical protein BDZ90DRAFT_232054 [Jaminaea rosea]|uniref:Asl1-like glycosyl hydrolase catalytic domain-containing protein n=1 Tax=Jaminaea rosea TaxID=1569628 RepID=A0A316UUP5_9BASI|nr:hypothetical protein BDZ90DRAFT_232054 [Jaminaea rosea]PWN27633.1 hypothetical protein BDZ90DRAFT_232054 [Jaminaea rosea]